MAQLQATTTRITIGARAYLEGPADYLENVSIHLLAWLVALLAAPPKVERSVCVAFRKAAAREGLDAEDVEFLMMACVLSDDTDDRDAHEAA